MSIGAVVPVSPPVPEQMLADDAGGSPDRASDHGKQRDHAKHEPRPKRKPSRAPPRPAPGTGLAVDELA
jgi:hypothetical protein